jgi:hypothetical protein
MLCRSALSWLSFLVRATDLAITHGCSPLESETCHLLHFRQFGSHPAVRVHGFLKRNDFNRLALRVAKLSQIYRE